jgi:hypothetical protein
MSRKLTKHTESLYTWRKLELSRVKPYRWILAFNGGSKQLPCGRDSRSFINLDSASRYLELHGYELK